VVSKPNKKAALVLRPPFGFFTPSLAQRGENPELDFTFCIEYDLAGYRTGEAGRSRIFAGFSPREYVV
jgi:hypothetical protein